MRSALRAVCSLAAAAAAILALTSSSLPDAASVAAPKAVHKVDFVFPAYRAMPPILSDVQRITAAAPARVALAAKEAAAAAERRKIALLAATGHRVYVWTSGFQAQVNACRGGVDLTAAYHTRTVAEHWQCGGSSFPERAGSIVTFTGLDAGTYRVIGVVAVLNAYTAHTRNIPHGYEMLYQTCYGGDSHHTVFIGLARI
jgi:hypothetical protein